MSEGGPALGITLVVPHDGDYFALQDDLTLLALGPALVGGGKSGPVPLVRQQQQRIWHRPVQQLQQPRRLGRGPQGEAQHGDLQILPHFVAILRHANGRGLERRQPDQLLDAVVNDALVGDSGRTILKHQFFGHTLIHAATRGQIEGRKDCVAVHPAAAFRESGNTASQATTSKSLMPANSPFMAWVPPVWNRLATARSSFLPTTEATAAASRRCAARMSSPRLVVLSNWIQAPASGKSRPRQSRLSRSRICLACV